MLPAHKGELPEDTEGKDPAVQSVGARCSAQALAAGVSAGRKTRGGRHFLQGMTSLCANRGV